MSAMIEVMATVEHLSTCLLCTSGNIKCVDPEFNFAKCLDCGYVFDNPRLTRESVVEYYSAHDKYEHWLQQDASRDSLWHRRLRKFLTHARPGNLLDVGTGIGQFLSIAKPHFTDVAGTEVSASAVEIARSRYGLNVMRGEVETIDLPPSSFQNITLFHVLEHVHDPIMTIQACYSLLQPGGVLLVCVPNDIWSWSARLRVLAGKIRRDPKRSSVYGLRHSADTQEIHLSHFTPRTLRAALERCGFSVRRVDCDPFYAASGSKLLLHHLNYQVHHLLRLPTYQAMWVIAEKRKT